MFDDHISLRILSEEHLFLLLIHHIFLSSSPVIPCEAQVGVVLKGVPGGPWTTVGYDPEAFGVLGEEQIYSVLMEVLGQAFDPAVVTERVLWFHGSLL